jgi:hypothetical protein
MSFGQTNFPTSDFTSAAQFHTTTIPPQTENPTKNRAWSTVKKYPIEIFQVSTPIAD